MRVVRSLICPLAAWTSVPSCAATAASSVSPCVSRTSPRVSSASPPPPMTGSPTCDQSPHRHRPPLLPRRRPHFMKQTWMRMRMRHTDTERTRAPCGRRALASRASDTADTCSRGPRTSAPPPLFYCSSSCSSGRLRQVRKTFICAVCKTKFTFIYLIIHSLTSYSNVIVEYSTCSLRRTHTVHYDVHSVWILFHKYSYDR